MTASRPVSGFAQRVTPQQLAQARPVFDAQPVRPAATTVGVTPAVARQFNFQAPAPGTRPVAPGPAIHAMPAAVARAPPWRELARRDIGSCRHCTTPDKARRQRLWAVVRRPGHRFCASRRRRGMPDRRPSRTVPTRPRRPERRRGRTRPIRAAQQILRPSHTSRQPRRTLRRPAPRRGRTLPIQVAWQILPCHASAADRDARCAGRHRAGAERDQSRRRGKSSPVTHQPPAETHAAPAGTAQGPNAANPGGVANPALTTTHQPPDETHAAPAGTPQGPNAANPGGVANPALTTTHQPPPRRMPHRPAPRRDRGTPGRRQSTPGPPPSHRLATRQGPLRSTQAAGQILP